MPEPLHDSAQLLTYWMQGFHSRRFITESNRATLLEAGHVFSIDTLLETAKIDNCPSTFLSETNLWLALCLEKADTFSHLRCWVPLSYASDTQNWVCGGYPTVHTKDLSSHEQALLEQFWAMTPAPDNLEWPTVLCFAQQMLQTIASDTQAEVKQGCLVCASQPKGSYQHEVSRIALTEEAITPLIARYIATDCPDSAPEHSPQEIAHEGRQFLGGWNKSTLSADARQVLWHCLNLAPKQIQALETPLGSNLEVVLAAYASTCQLRAFSEAGSVNKVVLIVADADVSRCPRFDVERWLEGAPSIWSSLAVANKWIDDAPVVSLERRYVEKAQTRFANVNTLQDVISELTSSIAIQSKTLEQSSIQAQQVVAIRYRLDREYQNNGGLDAKWKALQEKDIALEEAYSALAQACVEWTSLCKAGVVGKIARVLPFGQRHWREKIWNFYETHLKGLITWQEDGFNLGAGLAEVLHARLRAIRTERSKLHQQMVPISDAIAQRTAAESKWLQWQKSALPDYNFGSFADIESARDPSRIANEVESQLRQQLAHSVLHLGEGLFLEKLKDQKGIADRLDALFLLCPIVQATKAQLSNLLALPKKFSAKTAVGRELLDMVFIQSATLAHPIDALPLLYRSKRAVFLGDRLHSTCACGIAEGEDNQLALSAGIVQDDMDYDEQRAKGLVHANANTFLLARSNSAFKPAQTYGLAAQSDLMLTEVQVAEGIAGYLNQKVYANKLVSLPSGRPASFPSFATCHVKGVVTGEAQQMSNLREAQAIAVWLKKHLPEIKALEGAGQSLQPVCVVTTTDAQKKQLIRLVPPGVTVATVKQLPTALFNWVIFSPVVTALSRRPFAFDIESTLIAKLVSMASQSFMVFSDLDIFDAQSTTPSGFLARALFESKYARLQSELLPITPADYEQIAIASMTQLKSLLDQLVQKAQSEIVISGSRFNIKTIEQLRLTGDLNKAIGRKVKVELIIPKRELEALGDNKILHTWKKVGVHFSTVPQAHTNALFIDDSEVLEFNAPILCVGDEGFPIQALSYQGASAQMAKSVLKNNAVQPSAKAGSAPQTEMG